jgi:tetratricopeptide (TPR) repeat protein
MRYAGNLEGSLEVIQKAQTMAESATYRSEAARARAMFGIIWRQGEILGQDGQVSLGKPDEATVAFQKSLDLMEDVAKADANDTSSRVLIAQAARELGSILSRRNPARALAVYDHGLLRIREFQNNVKARRDEARLLALSSYALRRLNRSGEAKQQLDMALQLLRDTKAYPGDRIVLLSDAEIVLRAWGDHLADSGEVRQALGVFQELLEKVMAAHPEPTADLSNATGMSRIYEALATLHLRSGDAAHSQSMSAARLVLWQDWARKLPENTYVKQQLEAANRP